MSAENNEGRDKKDGPSQAVAFAGAPGGPPMRFDDSSIPAEGAIDRKERKVEVSSLSAPNAASAPAIRSDDLALQLAASKAAFQLLELAAEGDVASQCALAKCYHRGGNGITVNEAKAAFWYRKAAEAGNADAQYRLGWFLREGWGGVGRDDIQAAQWFYKAANQKHGKSLEMLAYLYSEGCGVEKDAVKAGALFNVAIEAGVESAREPLQSLISEDPGLQLKILALRGLAFLSQAVSGAAPYNGQPSFLPPPRGGPSGVARESGAPAPAKR